MNAASPARIRLVMTDLDGTLLNSHHAVTFFTDQVVHEVTALGILFTVATGKTFPSTEALIQQFDIRVPLICGNGTQVFAPDGTLLHEDPIPVEYALEAVQLATEVGFTPVVYTRMGLVTNDRNVNVAELVAHHEPEPEIVPDLAAALRGDYRPYKLVIMNQDRAAVSAFQRVMEQRFEGRAQVLRSGLASVVEVVPLGVTKGTALAVICDALGIKPHETICFGDNCNDVDMIRRAGIGVAMGQSPEDVRRAADYVTGTNDEDGVAHALRRLVLAPQDRQPSRPS